MTYQELKDFVNSLDESQLQQEVVVHGENAIGQAHFNVKSFEAAKEDLYWSYNDFGLFTKQELLEKGEIDDMEEFEAEVEPDYKKGQIFLNAKAE